MYHVKSCLCLSVTSIFFHFFSPYLSTYLSVCMQAIAVHLSTCIYCPIYLFNYFIYLCKCFYLSFLPPSPTLLRPIFISIHHLLYLVSLSSNLFRYGNTRLHRSMFVYIIYPVFSVSFSLLCPLHL